MDHVNQPPIEESLLESSAGENDGYYEVVLVYRWKAKTIGNAVNLVSDWRYDQCALDSARLVAMPEGNTVALISPERDLLFDPLTWSEFSTIQRISKVLNETYFVSQAPSETSLVQVLTYTYQGLRFRLAHYRLSELGESGPQEYSCFELFLVGKASNPGSPEPASILVGPDEVLTQILIDGQETFGRRKRLGEVEAIAFKRLQEIAPNAIRLNFQWSEPASLADEPDNAHPDDLRHLRIPAEASTNDGEQPVVHFDALRYFEQASFADWVLLALCDFGSTESTEHTAAIATFFQLENVEISALLFHAQESGSRFECSVEPALVIAWLKEHKPEWHRLIAHRHGWQEE